MRKNILAIIKELIEYFIRSVKTVFYSSPLDKKTHNNLHNNNENGIVLSWAVKGQCGDGHVNCQNNDYIKSKICKLGYINDIEAEQQLRKHSTLSWFKNTIMVFRQINKVTDEN